MREFSMTTTKGRDFTLGKRPYINPDIGYMKMRGKKVLPFDPEPLSKRKGLNYEMRRNNFIAPDIMSRNSIDFEKLQSLAVADAGIKVELGDKTLRDLFQIQVPDETDTTWQQDGRKQRMITKMINLGQQSNDTTEQLNILKGIVNQNLTETLSGNKMLKDGIDKLITSSNDLSTLSAEQLVELKNVVQRLNIPAQPKQAGLKQVIYDSAEFQQNRMAVIPFILSKVPSHMTNLPIFGFQGPINLAKVVAELNAGNYLDVEQLSILSPSQAKDRVEKDGVDGGVWTHGSVSSSSSPSLASTVLAPTVPIGTPAQPRGNPMTPLTPSSSQGLVDWGGLASRTDLGNTSQSAYKGMTMNKLKSTMVDALRQTPSGNTFLKEFTTSLGSDNKISDTIKRLFLLTVLDNADLNSDVITKQMVVDTMNGLNSNPNNNTSNQIQLGDNMTKKEMVKHLIQVAPKRKNTPKKTRGRGLTSYGDIYGYGITTPLKYLQRP